MEPEATLTAQPVAAAEAQAAPSTEQASRLIPFPADKLRALNQEVSELRRQVRGAGQLTNQPAPEVLEPSAQKALDMIGTTVRNGITPELDEIRTGLDEARFDREIENLRQDPTASRYSNEISDEMLILAKKTPLASRTELLDQAKRNAIYNAVMNGTYQSAATEQAAEEILSDRSRFASSPARGGVQTGRGNEDRQLEDMSAEELAADPAKFNALFEKTQGRKQRR